MNSWWPMARGRGNAAATNDNIRAGQREIGDTPAIDKVAGLASSPAVETAETTVPGAALHSAVGLAGAVDTLSGAGM